MNRTALAFVLLAVPLVLAGCGNQSNLTPPPGRSLPPAPFARDEPLTAAELLELNPQAAPERNVELRSESEEREDDPFDLPPEG
jgi:hypothetical protein